MKKLSLVAIYNALTGFGYSDEEVLQELKGEIDKDVARKEATAKVYDEAHDAIVGNLGGTPVTCNELYEAIKDELPDGFTKGKVQWALTHLWESEIVKIEGKPNAYRRA